MTKSRGIHAPRVKWTEEQLSFLKAKFPHTKTSKIATDLGLPIGPVQNKAHSLGLKKTPEYLASPDACRLRQGGNVGAKFRFKPGQETWNKGMKGLNLGGTATQFKPGQVPKNVLPVGTIRISHDGYLEIKVEPGARKWVALSRWNWKNKHGEYPPKGYTLKYKDSNRMNCEVSNLILVSRGELMKQNTIHRYPAPLKEVIRLNSKIRRKINECK